MSVAIAARWFYFQSLVRLFMITIYVTRRFEASVVALFQYPFVQRQNILLLRVKEQSNYGSVLTHL